MLRIIVLRRTHITSNKLIYSNIKEFPPHEPSLPGNEWKDSIALYGDSCTWGQALEEKDRIHTQLKNISGKTVYNFGYPAQSNEHIFKKFIRHVSHYGYPSKVVIGWTSPWRFASISEKHPEGGSWTVDSIGHWTFDTTPEHAAAKHLLDTSPRTLIVRTADYTIAIENMCKGRTELFQWCVPPKKGKSKVTFDVDNNITHFPQTSNDWYKLTFDDKGSDNMHPGPKTIKKLAEQVCK